MGQTTSRVSSWGWPGVKPVLALILILTLTPAGNPMSGAPARLRGALAGGLELVEALAAEAARSDAPGGAPIDITGAPRRLWC